MAGSRHEGAGVPKEEREMRMEQSKGRSRPPQHLGVSYVQWELWQRRGVEWSHLQFKGVPRAREKRLQGSRGMARWTWAGWHGDPTVLCSL